jgi:hypothetical protein
VGSQTFRGRRQTAGDGNIFFVKNGFSSIKSPNSSRKSIKKIFFRKLRNQYFILTSFIESKKELRSAPPNLNRIYAFAFVLNPLNQAFQWRAITKY